MPSTPQKRRRNLTAFGEPLWLDALKTTGVALATLAFMLLVGAVLGLMIIAPWARASPECSMYCVVEKRVERFLGGG